MSFLDEEGVSRSFLALCCVVPHGQLGSLASVLSAPWQSGLTPNVTARASYATQTTQATRSTRRTPRIVPMRTIHQATAPFSLIAGQPRVQRLPRDTDRRGHLRHRLAIRDHRQYSVIRCSATLNSLIRRQCQASTRAIYDKSGPGSVLFQDIGDRCVKT